MLIGNKVCGCWRVCSCDDKHAQVDLEDQRQVSKEEAQKFASDHDLAFFEVSAKTAYQIDAAFIDSANKIHAKVKEGLVARGAA